MARARNLPRTEHRITEVLRDEVVIVTPTDVDAVLLATRVATRLSAALAVELDRTAAYVGHQPQPGLLAALARLQPARSIERDADWAHTVALHPAMHPSMPARAAQRPRARAAAGIAFTLSSASRDRGAPTSGDQVSDFGGVHPGVIRSKCETQPNAAHRPCTPTSITDVAELCAVTTAAAQILTAPPRRAAAVTYLRQRGINPDHIPAGWPLGYAPPGWTRLVDTLRGQYSDQALLDAGLARVSSRGSLIDTFRERVIFPVHHAHGDLRGQVAGFIGRDLSGHTGTPKYLNSRHSSIYVKSELLYGLHEGRTATRSPSTIVVVEGPLDVLAITARAARDGRGDLWPVAASGTAFTSAHARQIAAHADEPEVVVALDADAPGRAAALVAGERLHGAGLDVRIAVLPNGMDPADYLSETSSTLDTFTSNTRHPTAHRSGRASHRRARRPHAMDRRQTRRRADHRAPSSPPTPSATPQPKSAGSRTR